MVAMVTNFKKIIFINNASANNKQTRNKKELIDIINILNNSVSISLTYKIIYIFHLYIIR